MRDTGNQIVLGTFVATFLYALLVLQTISEVEGRVFVPRIAVTIGTLLAVAGVAVLIYFIHHVSASIQAENIIAAVGRDLDSAIDRLFPEQAERASEGRTRQTDGPAAEIFERLGHPIPATRTGYLQAIDHDGLMNIATEIDLVLRVKHRPGDFVVEQGDLVLVWPSDKLTEEPVQRVSDAFPEGEAE